MNLMNTQPTKAMLNGNKLYSQCPHCLQFKSSDDYNHFSQCKEYSFPSRPNQSSMSTSPSTKIIGQPGSFYAAPLPPLAVPMPPSVHSPTLHSVPSHAPMQRTNQMLSPQVQSTSANAFSFQTSPQSSIRHSPLMGNSPTVSSSPVVITNPVYERTSPFRNATPSPQHPPSQSIHVIPPSSNSNPAKKPRTRSNAVVDTEETANEGQAVPPSNYKFKPKAWKPMPHLPEAPVFKPTEEEFQDPMKYIASIRDTVKKFGVCKIIPPSSSWLQNKPFTKVVNPKTLIFQTKLQTIHQLQTRLGPNERFLEDLKVFLKQNNQPMVDHPVVDGQELDLYKLYTAVMSRGGLHAVVRNKRWGEIVKELKISTDLVSAANLLKKHYYRYVYNYELQQSLKRNAIDSMSEKELRDWENAAPKEEKKDDDDEFGYGDGKMFTLTTFKKYANAFKKKWFDMDEEIPPEEIEHAFWRIVENCEDNVQVHYGSDLDVSTTGSGFPNDPEDLKKASGWNLNIFA